MIIALFLSIMALPAPEGIVYFKRDLLKSSQFDLTNTNNFYNTVLLEVNLNESYDEGYKGNNDPKLPHEIHKRAGKQVISYDATKYVRWQAMTCMTGSSTRGIKRQFIWNAQGDARGLYRRTKKHKIGFIPVPYPKPDEKYLWVDLVFPIRAIYIPASFIAHRKYPKYCSYVHLNFRVRDYTLDTYVRRNTKVEEFTTTVGKNVGGLLGNATKKLGGETGKVVGETEEDFVDGQFLPGAKKDVEEPDVPEAEQQRLKGEPSQTYWTGTLGLKSNETFGWNWREQWTARFDIDVLKTLLLIPLDSRDDTYYDPSSFITLFEADAIKALDSKSKTSQSAVMDDWIIFDYVKIFSKHAGIKVDYAEDSTPVSSIEQIIMGVLGAKASLIPHIGPLVSLGVNYVASWLEDPDSFVKTHNLAKMGVEVGIETTKAANAARKFYADGKVPHVRLPRRGRSKLAVEESDDRKPIKIDEDTGDATTAEKQPDTKASEDNKSEDGAEQPQVDLQDQDEADFDEVDFDDLDNLGYDPDVGLPA